MELAFVGLAPALKDKLDGQDFTDVNRVLHRDMAQENRARDQKSFGWFRELGSKEKLGVNCVEDEAVSDEDARVCVAL
jgi:hypothetical protein